MTPSLTEKMGVIRLYVEYGVVAVITLLRGLKVYS